MIVLYLNICWGNVHYLSVLQDKRFRESDGIVVITIFFMDERFCAFVLLLSICCVNNAFFIMLQYIWDILYISVSSCIYRVQRTIRPSGCSWPTRTDTIDIRYERDGVHSPGVPHVPQLFPNVIRGVVHQDLF